MNLICIVANSKALIKMSPWNVYFEQQISLGKIFPVSNWVVAVLIKPAVRKKPQCLPRLFTPREQIYLTFKQTLVMM